VVQQRQFHFVNSNIVLIQLLKKVGVVLFCETKTAIRKLNQRVECNRLMCKVHALMVTNQLHNENKPVVSGNDLGGEIMASANTHSYLNECF